MATDPNTLPQWQGHAVPWVTRWTHEVSKDSVKLSLSRDGLFVHYPDGNENREPSGILWRREGLSRGGRPEFSQVNAYRQRLAMAKRRCQVCGNKITSEAIRWLMAPEQLEEVREGGTALTMSPPTCDDCIPLALELCPHLKKGHIIVKVLDYRIWGVMGSIIGLREQKPVEFRGQMVGYDVDYEFPKACVIAYQQVVELTKFAVEKSPGEVAPREETLNA